VSTLDSFERTPIAVVEGAPKLWPSRETICSSACVAKLACVGGGRAVELSDKLLIGVVPLALRCESAERPDRDRERER
jgi:hypothetical protein